MEKEKYPSPINPGDNNIFNNTLDSLANARGVFPRKSTDSSCSSNSGGSNRNGNGTTTNGRRSKKTDNIRLYSKGSYNYIQHLTQRSGQQLGSRTEPLKDQPSSIFSANQSNQRSFNLGSMFPKTPRTRSRSGNKRARYRVNPKNRSSRKKLAKVKSPIDYVPFAC